ncbi:hypothetical protein [Flavobacterium sp. JP2137]|uniref:hypothetical protein n=1 Tax=Flavobacterium sp. JP2137 TaxID=3414510 RepID=UPI003D2FA319
MKKKILMVLMLLCSLFFYGQEKLSYESKNGLIEFEVSKDKYYFEVSNGKKKKILEGVLLHQFLSTGIYPNSATVWSGRKCGNPSRRGRA